MNKINWKRVLYYTLLWNVVPLLLGTGLMVLSLLFPEGSPGILGCYFIAYAISAGVGLIGGLIWGLFIFIDWLDDWSY